MAKTAVKTKPAVTIKEAPAKAKKPALVPMFLTRPVVGIKLYDKNARTHDPVQIEELARAMLEFGYTQPVLVDKQGLLAGHGRVAAVKLIYSRGQSLKFAGSGISVPAGHIPYLDVSGLTETQRRQYIIWDNKSALKAGWDFELLATELHELSGLPAADLTLTGFSVGELDDMLKTDGFAPELNPQSLHNPVTGDQITNSEGKLLGKYSGAADQPLLDVMCPHCSKEFYIDRPK